MARRSNPAAYVIFGLLAIGILSRLLENPMGWIIPVAIFGGVYLLYKFPPGRTRGQKTSRFTAAPPRQKQKKRTTTFRVIQGSKSDSDDDSHHIH